MVTATKVRPAQLEAFPTNRELSNRTGLSEATISRIFTGEREVALGRNGSAQKLMKALEIRSLDVLMEVVNAKRSV